MNGTAFNISMVFLADTARAKAALADVSGGIRAVSAEAGKGGAAARRQAAELEAMAAAAAKAARAQQDLVAAERQAQQTRPSLAPMVGPVAKPAMADLGPAFRASQTAASDLRDTVAGLKATIGSQAQDMVEAARSAAAYQSALDDIRASFNPLFAASRQYEQQLDRIAEAERLGAISAREAAEARRRAASIISPIPQAMPKAGGIGAGSNTAYFAAQANDVAMMAMLGQSPLALALQQGPQISQMMNQLGGGMTAVRAVGAGIMSMINPLSLATIGIVALGAAAIQWLGSLREEVKTAEEALADLSKSVDGVKAANDAARASVGSMAEEFGAAAGEARALLGTLAEIKRQSAGRDAQSAMKSIYEEMTGGYGFGLRTRFERFSTLQSMFGEKAWLTAGRINAEDSPLTFPVFDALKGAYKAAEDGNLEDQIDAAERLLDALQKAAPAIEGVSREEAAWIEKVAAGLLDLKRLKAEDENTAGKAKAGEMARELERRAELEQTILRYGAQSEQARVVENRQEREALALRLEDLRITRDSAEGRRTLAALAEVQAAREAAARENARSYLRDQDDRIANLRMETALIGQSAEQQNHVRALAEVEGEIRKGNLGLLDGMLARLKAIGIAEAENSLARARAMQQLKVQSMVDGYDARIAVARDPVSRADLEAQRDYARAIAEHESADIAAARAAQTRARAINEVIGAGRVQIADMSDELLARQAIAAQLASGAIGAADSNRLLREELELRPLIAAAARAEGAEKQRLLDVVAGLRLAYEAQAAEERRQAQNEYLKSQAERVQQLRVELALVGATAAERARILAMIKAESEIARLGMSGAAADDVRRKAQDEIVLVEAIEAQADAWKRVQSAGEAAIDSVLDKLKAGDIKGALADFIGEIEKGFFDLAIRNPLKNAIFGTNLGTLDDIGGLGGIWDRLTGRSKPDEKGILDMATAPVQSMVIAATSVILNASTLLSGSPAVAANLNMAPGAGGAFGGAATAGAMMGGLSGPADVQSTVWNFFAGKGLAPHQIAGIMGNVSAESGFDPWAKGDAGKAFGLMQWNDRSSALFDFIGGQAQLGNIQKQLEFAWHELMTSEAGPMRRLMASTDVRGATEAFVGFERPQDYTLANPAGAMHFDKRLAAAEQALVTFGSTTQATSGQLQHSAEVAGAGLGNLGKQTQQAGIGFGQLLSSIAGMIGGDAGAILNAGIGIASQVAAGVPLYDTGGYTGDSDPSRAAGIVHGGEYVFNAAATRRIGVANLEGLHRGALRGFRDGGLVSRMPVLAGPAANSAPQGAAGRGEVIHMNFDLTGARGNREIEELVQKGVSAALQTYNRDALPRRVQQIVTDSRRTG